MGRLSAAAMLPVLAAPLATLGCVDAPAEDGASPLVEVTFLRAVGTPTVRSTDETLEAPANCAYTAGPAPWRVLVTVTDPGGIDEFGVRVPLGSATVDAFAPDPGATASVAPTPGGENVTVAIDPRPDSLVQTRADVTVDVSGVLPQDVRGWGRDLAGNYAETQSFQLEDPDSAVICRAESDSG